jgi:hypothetical protein
MNLSDCKTKIYNNEAVFMRGKTKPNNAKIAHLSLRNNQSPALFFSITYTLNTTIPRYFENLSKKFSNCEQTFNIRSYLIDNSIVYALFCIGVGL